MTTYSLTRTGNPAGSGAFGGLWHEHRLTLQVDATLREYTVRYLAASTLRLYIDDVLQATVETPGNVDSTFILDVPLAAGLYRLRVVPTPDVAFTYNLGGSTFTGDGIPYAYLGDWISYPGYFWDASIKFDVVPPRAPSNRWTFKDLITEEVYAMPINPNAMAPLPRQRTLSYGASIRVGRDRPRTMRSPTIASEWSFSGVLRTKAQHDALRGWALSGHLVEVTDHLGRVSEVVFTSFDPVDRPPTPRTPWRFTYTMKALYLRRTQ